MPIRRRQNVRSTGLTASATALPRARPSELEQRTATISAPLHSAASHVQTIGAFVDAARQLRKSSGPEGSERLLGAAAAARLEQAVGADAHLAAHLNQALLGLTPVRAALVLKSYAARVAVLQDPSTQQGGYAVLKSFASRLQALSDAEARSRSTALDLDSRVNSVRFDALTLWSRRGTIYDTSRDDDAADNDGLYQRFTGSCGPTVVQMMMAEADPVYAFALHDADLTSDETRGEIAAFQERVLESYGGIAIGRRESQLRARMNNALGRLVQRGRVDAQTCAATRAHLFEGAPATAATSAAISQCQKAFAGFPDAADVKRMRRRTWPKRDEGITTDAFAHALNTHAAPLTAQSYHPTNPADGFARGQVWRHIDTLFRTLRQGRDVPFGISEPGHWMLACAARGKKPSREFLIADPDGGRTQWVSERDFVRGVFADKQFGLAEVGQRPWVDVLLLPGQ